MGRAVGTTQTKSAYDTIKILSMLIRQPQRWRRCSTSSCTIRAPAQASRTVVAEQFWGGDARARAPATVNQWRHIGRHGFLSTTAAAVSTARRSTGTR